MLTLFVVVVVVVVRLGQLYISKLGSNFKCLGIACEREAIRRPKKCLNPKVREYVCFILCSYQWLEYRLITVLSAQMAASRVLVLVVGGRHP